MEFKNRIVMIGYGVVAQALLPMLVKHLRMPNETYEPRIKDRSE